MLYFCYLHCHVLFCLKKQALKTSLSFKFTDIEIEIRDKIKCNVAELQETVYVVRHFIHPVKH